MGVKMRSFFDQIFDQNFDQNFEKNFHENSTFVPVSLKSKIYGRKVEIFWKLPSFNKIYSDFIKFLLKIYGTNYEIYCVIKGSFWGPQDPLDPPRTPLGPRKRAVYGTNPRFYPLLTPEDPPGPPPGTPWPWPGLFGKMGGQDPQNEVKSAVSGTKRVFWWHFPDFGPRRNPPRPLKWPKIVKNWHFLDPPKKGGVSTWFFSKMNVPEGVNTEAENLLSRIPIRDSTFFDEFFVIF